MPMLKVSTFTPNFGLPAGGPFDLKLLAWLTLAGVPYEQTFEDDPRKGPKGKSPWIEFEGQRIGDTEIVIDLLGKRYGVDLDQDLTPEQRAIGHAWRRTFEEHFHQVLEWELLIHPAGWTFMESSMRESAPPVLGRIVPHLVRSHFRKQLHARGIGRHPPEIIEAKGRADLDALAAYLQGRTFLVSDQPTSSDAAVFGLIAPMVYWSMATPVALYARSLPSVAAFCERMRARCFGGDEPQSGAR